MPEVGIHWLLCAAFLGWILGREYQRWITRKAMDVVSAELRVWMDVLRQCER